MVWNRSMHISSKIIKKNYDRWLTTQQQRPSRWSFGSSRFIWSAFKIIDIMKVIFDIYRGKRIAPIYEINGRRIYASNKRNCSAICLTHKSLLVRAAIFGDELAREQNDGRGRGGGERKVWSITGGQGVCNKILGFATSPYTFIKFPLANREVRWIVSKKWSERKDWMIDLWEYYSF